MKTKEILKKQKILNLLEIYDFLLECQIRVKKQLKALNYDLKTK